MDTYKISGFNSKFSNIENTRDSSNDIHVRQGVAENLDSVYNHKNIEKEIIKPATSYLEEDTEGSTNVETVGQKIVATTKANDGLSVVQESEQLIISNEGDIIHDIYGNGRTQQFG